MNEHEARMENMLATVDKVFKVELMKMPPSLQKTRIGDLMSGELSNRLYLFIRIVHKITSRPRSFLSRLFHHSDCSIRGGKLTQ